MKKFTKFVGILLCLAMVLSILPASIVGAVDTGAAAQSAAATAVTGLATPTVGYYTDNNTDGAITEHYNTNYAPANLIDGDTGTQTRSLDYTYAEVASGAKVPVIFFELGEEKSICAVEIDTYKATYYGIDDFTIQVATANGWETVKEVTGAFSGAEHGETCDPETYTFDATTGTKVRILVTKLSDMTAYAGEAPAMATTSHIRLRGITLYETTGETTEPEATEPEATEPEAALQKLDLSGTVVGTCSSPYNANVSYKNQSWYSSSHAGWKNMENFVDGDYTTDVTFGVGEEERGDFYADLTRKNGSAMSADKLVLYYGASGNSTSMPTVTIILELAGGTQVEETFTTNWAGQNTADPLVWIFDETYEIEGIYVWSPNSPKSSFGEIELYSGSVTEPEATEPEATEPATEPEATVPGETITKKIMQKIDLLNCVVGCCSSPYSSNVSYKNQSWYSSSHAGWRDLNHFVDGDYSNEIHFGASSPERPDVYIDLTRKNGSAVAVDQLKLHHSGYGAVPSVYVVLELEDGTQVEKTITLGWEAGVDVAPMTWSFDETYNVKGVYIWQNNNEKACYGEIEMYQLAEVEVPVDPELPQITDLAVPAFGYYADGNTDGSITEYYADGYGPAGLVDNDWSTQTRSESYTYNEIQTAVKVPVILFTLNEATSLAGVEINGYEYGRYNMTNFTIQVYTTDGEWVTVKEVTKAFDTASGTYGADTEPVMYRFDAIVGTQVRILVNDVTFMGDEDMDQKTSVEGFRIREISLYEGYGEAPDESTDPEPSEPSILDELVVMENVAAPSFGYYTDNDTDGAITDYSHATHIPANMVNGNVTDQARSGYYTHAEIASGAKVPVILFSFENPVTLGGVDIYGYETSRYNMEDFEIQVYTTDGWVTAASVTDAFYVEGSFGEALSGPLTVEFDQLYTGTQMRILVSGISDMTADSAEDAEMAVGSYIRLREISLYYEEGAGEYLETATLNGADIGDYVIVYSADEPDYNLRAAKHIRNEIKKRTGRILTIVEDDVAETDCEILVGDTNRSLSQSVTAPANREMKFTIQTSGTKIALEADYFIIAGAAYYFTETYIDDADFETTVSSETREPITEKANNYIMLIGDGMGVNQTKLFDKFGAAPTTGNYGFSDGEDIFYGYYFPYQGMSRTENVLGQITDSAAGGTALATGYKTTNTRVGQDRNGRAVQNLSELALSLGMGAAVMTTEEMWGATPGSFSGHASSREQYNTIKATQNQLKAQGLIMADESNYYSLYTAQEWEGAEPVYISALEQVAENDSFFLMYEEAYIDKNCHNNNAPWAFRTLYRFNQAIGFFMEFAMYNPDTLVLITADHETGGMKSDFTFTDGNHSSQDVPVFAYGVGAEVFDTDTYYQNTSIGRTFAYMMTDGQTSFGDSQWPILGLDEEPEIPTNPTDPTEPAQDDNDEAPVVAPGTSSVGEFKVGEILSLVSTKDITTVFGYYDDNGTFVDKNDGYCVTDGWYGRAGYSGCTTADGQMALIMTLDEVKSIGRVEIVARSVNGASENLPVDFEIQAMVDGEWVTVVDVNNNPFTSSLTAAYKFPAVTTDQIRILINAVNIPTNECHINEVELYEVTTNRVYNNISLAGTVAASDAHDSAPIDNLIDGDKASYFLGANVTFNLTNGAGNPTAVDGFRLFNYRGNQAFASNVTIAVQTTPGGEFVELNTYATNWVNGAPLEQVIVEFAETIRAYGLRVTLDNYSYANELELFQFERETFDIPEDPDPTTPTEPETQPTEPETQPTEPETQPTEPETQPTEPETQPTEPETQPTEPETQPTEPETQPTEPETQPTEPETQPTEPETQPTEPETQPTEPETQPTEPETQPTEPETQPDEPGEDDLPADTGDIALIVLTGMMGLSAIGGAVVVGKKKD